MTVAMFEIFHQFDQLQAGVCGVFAGVLSCWLVQKYLNRRQLTRSALGLQAAHGSATPAIDAAAQANASYWFEPEMHLFQLQEILHSLESESSAPKSAQTAHRGFAIARQLEAWITHQKHRARRSSQDDTAAAIKQRAAEDEQVLQWLHDHPGVLPHTREEMHPELAHPEVAHPELALTQIASELLPFNPAAGRLSGNSGESEHSATNLTETVERIEKLLASVDPPESLAKPPMCLLGTLTTTTPAVRDPQGRLNAQPEDPQRRRSDQAIIYETLLRRCLGDDDFAWRMLHKFPTRCRSELELLATELRRRAWVGATRRINQLRGMAANIAAENLRDALGNLETVCRKQSATRADQLLEAVHNEFQQVLDFLARGDGVCLLQHHSSDENRPMSRLPAGCLSFEEQPVSLALPGRTEATENSLEAWQI